MTLLRVTGLIIVSYVGISIAVGMLFADSPAMSQFTMRVTAVLLACAFLTCLLKGIVFGFDRVRAEVSVEGVFGIVAFLIATAFIVSQLQSCAGMLTL